MITKIKLWLRPRLNPKTILWTHLMRAKLAARWFGFPGRKIKVIGVTGTNGKTTTCFLIGSILEQTGAKIAELTTIRFKIGDQEWQNNHKMTTLSPWILQKFLFQALKAGCEYAVIETTSHGLIQHRVYGVDFYGAVLTNITHDHLDYHRNFDKYVQAKLKLFKCKPEISVVNMDDPSSPWFMRQSASQKFSYGLGSKRADIRASKIIPQAQGEVFSLVTPQGQRTIQLNIVGKFNIYNALAAAGIGLGAGVSLDGIKRGLEQIRGVRGRLEPIKQGQPFYVILDYAHTPDALEKIYQVLRPKIKQRIIAVLGATGERDQTKRPKLGEITSRRADVIILTNEDPYTEDPVKIINQLAQGVEKSDKWQKGKNYFRILDRKKAIRKALALARSKDLVLITGKGHEEMMAVRHPQDPRLSVLVPFNERQIVQTQLRKMGYDKKLDS